MQEGNIIDLYHSTDSNIINKFSNNVDSKVHVSLDIDRL